ncbi:MAG: hypothetical protein IPP72_16320 [Chitinophagaceae bacterium]|nr:hypothetical protein [Chitinophagaceae bacterium]
MHQHRITGKYDNEKVLQSGFLAGSGGCGKASGYSFSGVAAPQNVHLVYSLSYEQFVVPLVKAVQEQQHIIDQQKTEISKQQKQYKTLKEQLDVLIKRLEVLEKKKG